MEPVRYIDALLLIEEKENEYQKINSDLRRLQGDFPTHVRCFDSEALDEVIKAFDDAFEEMTGIEDIASYYLWESAVSGKIKKTDGNIYTWETPEEFRFEVFRMIRDKNNERNI
jgi:hypothetical protein